MQKDKEVSLQNLSDGEDQPTNEVEKAVAEIWRGVFGIEQLGIHHNFSQLGGHSLLAMQIVAKIRSSYQIGLTLREFFATPTIAELSSVVQARVGGEDKRLTDDQARPLVAPMGQRFFCASRIQKMFFFGQSNQQVFASYHPPVGGGGQVLTVICPPLSEVSTFSGSTIEVRGIHWVSSAKLRSPTG